MLFARLLSWLSLTWVFRFDAFNTWFFVIIQFQDQAWWKKSVEEAATAKKLAETEKIKPASGTKSTEKGNSKPQLSKTKSTVTPKVAPKAVANLTQGNKKIGSTNGQIKSAAAAGDKQKAAPPANPKCERKASMPQVTNQEVTKVVPKTENNAAAPSQNGSNGLTDQTLPKFTRQKQSFEPRIVLHQSHLNMARVCSRMKDFNSARLFYEKCIKIEPKVHFSVKR